jgi:hypothetical protein
VGILVGAFGLGACSAARTGLGTSDESCYLALPVAEQAVGGHGHLAGVRKISIGELNAIAPRLSRRISDQLPKGQGICLAGYTGHFTAAEASKAIGRPVGTVAVVVVTTPGNHLLGTLILTKVPVRFQHSHIF